MQRWRWWGVGVVATVASVVGAWRSVASNPDFSRRLSAGCEVLEDCQELEAEAEARAQRCWISCGREAAEVELARALRYRARERNAVREHYRQRDAAERDRAQAARAEQLDDWQREREARERASEREHSRQLELERLRQEHMTRRAAVERERRVSYFARLSSDGRAERLRRCHAARGACDVLVIELIDAAPDDVERRRLVELNEQLLVRPTSGAPSAGQPASPGTPGS